MAKNKISIGMSPPHPGAFIRHEVLEPLGLSVSGAADILDVRRATLSDLVNEKASLSPDMALRLDMAFGLDTRQMLEMQAWFDAHAVQTKRATLNVKRFESLSD